jgi:hypothetical protein
MASFQLEHSKILLGRFRQIFTTSSSVHVITTTDYGDRLIIADELEHLRAARLKIEQQANRIDELEAEVVRLEAACAMWVASLRNREQQT